MEICSYRSFDEDKVIFSEQQPSCTFYLLVKGKVTLYFSSDKIIEVFPGQVFGDWAMLSDTVRLATAKANLKAEAIAIDYIALKNPIRVEPSIALKIVLALTKPIISRLQSPAHTASKILIAEGENQYVEFKESLRMNAFTNKKDDKMEFAAMKTIAGFLNSQGGVLFLGVKDNGQIQGLASDGFENEDRLLLHFGNLLHARLGKNAAAYVKETILELDGHTIMRVDCAASPEPVFMETKEQQYFFVRQGAQTLSYNLKETVNYIRSHY